MKLEVYATVRGELIVAPSVTEPALSGLGSGALKVMVWEVRVLEDTVNI